MMALTREVYLLGKAVICGIYKFQNLAHKNRIQRNYPVQISRAMS